MMSSKVASKIHLEGSGVLARWGSGRKGDLHEMLRFYEEAAGVKVAKKRP